MEQKIRNVNILLTCADDRNDNETSTFMDGGRGNAIESRAGAWLNSLTAKSVLAGEKLVAMYSNST